MWGSILTEANTLTNFNFGFSTYKSDILLHLSQWQYWWWFWFSLVWSVYFFLIIRLMSKRTFTFNPIINTSIRGHGKWGDFLVAIIPLSWCGNILVNSNFILRMIEWQNESSLFTIRVQGKQWYWVYKFDASAAQNIFAAPKNIGNNRWFINSPTESYCADTYYQALNLGTQLEFKSLYYKYLQDDSLTQSNLNADSLQTNSEVFNRLLPTNRVNIALLTRIELYNTRFFKKFFMKKHYFVKTKYNLIPSLSVLKNLETNPKLVVSAESLLKTYSETYLNFSNKNSYYDFDQLDDLSNFAANVAQQNFSKPLMFARGVLNKHNIDLLLTEGVSKFEFENYTGLVKLLKNRIKKLKNIPFYRKKTLTLKELKRLENRPERVYMDIAERLKKLPKKIVKFNKNLSLLHFILKKKISTLNSTIWNVNIISSANSFSLKKPIFFNILFKNNSGVVEKVEDNELLWGFRQKKYKRFKKFFFNKGYTYNPKTLEPINAIKSTSRQFKNNIVVDVGVGEKSANINYHNAIKYNRHRHELVPVNLARRLLRVKRTLVLPAHVNITLISNSYDVVHSWFIPGLGLKIDCVPGRSTHHTFYVDNVGFYYGQCAEICGRYHHHMPIRLCALPFEHFLVWWQKKGLKRLHRFSSLRSPDAKKLPILNGVLGK